MTLAFFHRIVVAIFLFCSISAHAFAPTYSVPSDKAAEWAASISASAADCQAGLQYWCQTVAACPSSDPAVQNVCLLNGFGVPRDVIAYVGSCPAGSGLSGGSCTCTAPSVENAAHNGCDIPPPPPPVNNCPKAGVSQGSWAGPGSVGVHSICMTDVPSGDPASSGCRISGSSVFASGGYGARGDANGYMYTAPMFTTGETCVPDPVASGSRDTAPACAPPKIQGTFNGNPICYTPSPDTPTQSQNPKTTTTTNPDGTSTKTDVTPTTSCNASSCTTTTIITTTNSGPLGVIGSPSVTNTTSTCQRGAVGCSPVPAPPSTVTTITTPPVASPVGSPPGTVGAPSVATITTVGGSDGAGRGSSGDPGSFCADNPNSMICKDSGVLSDKALVDAPTLYTPKYPDGLSGVWTTSKATLMQSGLLQLTSNLTPTIIGTGGYPVFTVPVVIGKWNFGSYDVSPPGMVWDFLRVCVMVSALFLCRALIFGG
jgi:hypothetical protein